MWAGVTLLLMAVILAAAVAAVVAQEHWNIHAVLFGRDSSVAGRVALFVSVGAAIGGALLVRRWYRASHRWPYG
jgi:hypothetical protein